MYVLTYVRRDALMQVRTAINVPEETQEGHGSLKRLTEVDDPSI